MDEHDTLTLHQKLLDHAKVVTQHLIDHPLIVAHELDHTVDSAAPQNVSGKKGE
jgi:hypothetical protein